MNEARFASAGAHHKDLGFLISGGAFNTPVPDNDPVATTEISTDGITFNAFTQLPLGLHSHCMVALDGDDGEFLVIGGHTSSHFSQQPDYSWSPLVLKHKNNQWQEMNNWMPTDRLGKEPNLANTT